MTTSSTPTISELRELPVVERSETLEAILVAEFKAALLMTDEDELPFDQSYFDLGLTSLSITDLKQRLEQLLDCEIDANVLFNSPTVDRLLTYLTEDLLAGSSINTEDLLAGLDRSAVEEPTVASLDRALLGAALTDLYEQ